MTKTFKGAVAALAGALLLLGGAGSLAYWTSEQTVPGGAIDAGSLALGVPTCGGGWTLDAAGGGGTYTPGTTLLVPGDVITETCTATLTATGSHMAGTITASTPTVTGAAAGVITATVSHITDTSQDDADLTTTGFTEDNDGDTLSIQIAVTFVDPGIEDNSTQSLIAALGDITLTATQTHP